MNFTPEMLASMAKVEAAREANIALERTRCCARITRTTARTALA